MVKRRVLPPVCMWCVVPQDPSGTPTWQSLADYAGKSHSWTKSVDISNNLFTQLDDGYLFIEGLYPSQLHRVTSELFTRSTSGTVWSQSDVPHQQLSMGSSDDLFAVKCEAGQRYTIVVSGKVLKTAFVVINQLQQAFCKHNNKNIYTYI